MDQELAQKIINEISRFAVKKYALVDRLGFVLAKTEDFTLAHNPLEINSKRSFPISFNRKRVGYLYVDENLAVAKEIGPILKSMSELIIYQNLYRDFLTQDETKIDQLLFDYFHGDNKTAQNSKKALTALNVNLDENRVVILLEIAQQKAGWGQNSFTNTENWEQNVSHIKRQLSFIFSSFYTHHQKNIISYLGRNLFLILKDMGENPLEYELEFKKNINTIFYNIKKELRTKVTIGIGKFRSEKNGLLESFREAEIALNLGKQNWGEGKIYHFDNFGVVAPLFLGANSINLASQKKIIKTLKQNPEIYRTLEVFIESNTSISKTAKKLKIHRNTLIYRLERIAELTKLDPRIFNDAFQLYLNLILDKYIG